MSIQYRYDELNRLVGVVYEGRQEISYAYDAAGNRISIMVTGKAAQALVPAPAAALFMSRPADCEIIVLSGELEHQRFPVGDQLRLGREPDNDLTLPDKKASRHHAILQRQGVVYQITDLGSANGTYVNGQRIAQPTLLKNGDILLIGDTQLTMSDRP